MRNRPPALVKWTYIAITLVARNKMGDLQRRSG